MSMSTRPAVAVVAGALCLALIVDPAGARISSEPTVDAAIVHGTPTTPAEWPFLVQVAVANTEMASVGCTGSVISPTWVLTAAHCAAMSAGEGRVMAADPKEFRIFAGGAESFTGDARAVKRVVLHPKWQPVDFIPDNDGDGEPDDLYDMSDAELLDYLTRLGAYDLALMELSVPVSVAPVRLATAADGSILEAGDIATVLGWGSITADDQPGIRSEAPPTPRRATMRLLDPAAIGVTTTQSPLAVLAKGAGQSVCHGDSGGPLVVAGSDGQLRIAGVTSSGLSCATSEPTGAQFGNVAANAAWISQHVIDRPASGAPTPASYGTEGERALAQPATPLGRFRSVTPFRLIDSRLAGTDEEGEPITEGEAQAVGVGSVPASARGLLVNITTVESPDWGYRGGTWPCDTRWGYGSGFITDEGPVAWTTVIPLDGSGKLCWDSDDGVLTVDVLGWFGSEGTDVFAPAPGRLVDTRSSGVVNPGTPLTVAVHGSGSAMVNLTVIAGRRSGYAVAHPCVSGPGGVSTVNVERRQVRSNLTVVPVSAAGTICVSVSTPMHVVVDQIGSMGTGPGTFVSSEARLYQDYGSVLEDLIELIGEDLPDDIDLDIEGYHSLEIGVDDLGVVSPSARSLVVDVVMGSTHAGYAVAYSCDDPVPASSTVNVNDLPPALRPTDDDDWVPEMEAEGLAVVTLGPSRKLCVYAPKAASIGVYVEGWFE